MATTGPGTVLGASGNLKQLGVIVDRLTYLGACELLLKPQQISLKHSMSEVGTAVAGALLERQLAGLAGSAWKEGVRGVVATLLADALRVYGADMMPVRHVRVLLKCCEFTYHAGPEAAVGGMECPELMGREVEELLQREVGSAISSSNSRLWYLLMVRCSSDL